MRNLLIEQRGPSGLLKTWRVRPEQGLVTFGTSKHADLRSPEASVKGIQGVFEFRDGDWRYLTLDLNQSSVSDPVEQMLDKTTDIKMGHSRLQIVPYEARSTLFSHIETDEFSKPGGKTKPYQLFAVYHGDTLLETHIAKMGESFVSSFDSSNTKVGSQESKTWMRVPVGPIEVAQRTVHLTSAQALSVVSKDQLIDAESKRTVLAILVGAVILGLLFLLSPNSQNADEAAKNSVATDFKEPEIVLPKRKKIPLAEVEKKAAAAPPVQAPTQAPAAPANKVSAIKSISASRISQLLGKVSAATTKSANVVVSNGVVAGSAPSGAALSAVGKVTQSGKDWTAEGKGTGVAVSTVGRSGGTSGMGSLGAGKTGSGGAELLEEEGEITGGLDREVIAQYIKTQLGQILYCYERQLSATPDLYGKVSVRFTIGPTGGVEAQRIGESSLKNANVENCILQRLAKWKFPTPQGGTRVMVTYPFLFKSTN